MSDFSEPSLLAHALGGETQRLRGMQQGRGVERRFVVLMAQLRPVGRQPVKLGHHQQADQPAVGRGGGRPIHRGLLQ